MFKLTRLLCLVGIVALSLPCFALAQGAKIDDESLRQLEKDITAVRGLAFKTPVTAKVIARGKDGPKGVQGYYSTKDKTLYLYDDITGAYERGVLIHEMVHALQDQHFGLAKLHQESFGSDAEMALAALIEGDATFTMIELLKKDQPKVEAMLTTSLEKSKNLRNAFLYGLGARYVKGIKDKGGWASVNFRYRIPPRATASILSPGLTTIDLGPGKAVGAFGILETLGSANENRALVLAAVNGLIADRVVEDGIVKAWQLAFDTKDHALRFREAYAAYQSNKHDKLQILAAPPGQHRWRTEEGRVFAVAIRGTRVHVVEAPTEAALRESLEGLETPALTIYSAKEKRKISFGELTDRLLEADLICVGESHDNELCHRVQLQIIRAIHASDRRLGVGMEMFQRPYQPWLDKYIQGDIIEDRMLLETEYRTRWGFHWSLYQPIADFCKRNSVPMAALNVPRELTAKISKGGYKGLNDEDKKSLGPIDYDVKAHRDYWYERLPKIHGGTAKPTEEQKERGYQTMTTWDDYMGASAAAFQQTRHLRRMVVLAGSGHIDHGFGIPERAAKRTGGKAATVHVAPGGDQAKLFADPPADYIIVVR